jgi:hypothetical protein
VTVEDAEDASVTSSRQIPRNDTITLWEFECNSTILLYGCFDWGVLRLSKYGEQAFTLDGYSPPLA